jgi:hypothetical protein
VDYVRILSYEDISKPNLPEPEVELPRL